MFTLSKSAIFLLIKALFKHRLFMRNFLMDSLKAEGDSYGENCLAKEVNRNDKEDYVSIAHAIVDEKIRTNIFCGITPQGKTIICKIKHEHCLCNIFNSFV